MSALFRSRESTQHRISPPRRHNHIKSPRNHPDIYEPEPIKRLLVPLHLAQAAGAGVDADEEVGPEELDGQPVAGAEFLADDEPAARWERGLGLPQERAGHVSRPVVENAHEGQHAVAFGERAVQEVAGDGAETVREAGGAGSLLHEPDRLWEIEDVAGEP